MKYSLREITRVTLQKILAFIFLSTSLMLGAGCASSNKIPFPHRSEKFSGLDRENLNGDSPALSQTENGEGALSLRPQESNGDSQTKLRPIVLVLGPGLARGFAYGGVFKALNELKIPVAAVLGTEMGGLIGALYVTSKNLNQFEWHLLKFKEDVFLQERSFLSRFKGETEGQGDDKKLEQRLRESFGNRTLASVNIPFQIVVQSKNLKMPIVLNRGNFFELVRGAVAVPGFFSPTRIMVTNDLIQGVSGMEVISAGSSRPFLVTEARQLNLGPVVVIDVLNENESIIAADELKQADLVIKPDLSKMSYKEFRKRTEAAFQGKVATIQAAAELQRIREVYQPRESNSGEVEDSHPGPAPIPTDDRSIHP